MSKNFTAYLLGDIGNIITGKTPPTNNSNNYGNDYMFIGPTDLHKHFIINKSEKMISKQGLESIKGSILNDLSILVGCIGWDMGNVGLVKEKCATNQQINAITNIKDIFNPYYIYYWLTGKKEFLFKQASVTRTPILKKSDFAKIPINIPKKIIQDRVAHFLFSLDSKIELNNKINTELEAMAKTLYDYWFVQFDFPDSDGKPYKTSGGKMVWNAEFKREVPDGWEVIKINEAITVKDGTHDSPKSQETGYPFITSKHLLKSGIDFENANLISEADFVAINKRSKVETGDILFSMIGTIGTVYKIEEKEINFAIKNVALFKTSQKKEIKNYIYTRCSTYKKN